MPTWLLLLLFVSSAASANNYIGYWSYQCGGEEGCAYILTRDETADMSSERYEQFLRDKQAWEEEQRKKAYELADVSCRWSWVFVFFALGVVSAVLAWNLFAYERNGEGVIAAWMSIICFVLFSFW